MVKLIKINIAREHEKSSRDQVLTSSGRMCEPLALTLYGGADDQAPAGPRSEQMASMISGCSTSNLPWYC
jgi:hypothetical protein